MSNPGWTPLQAAAIEKDEEKLETIVRPMAVLFEWWWEANEKKNASLHVDMNEVGDGLQTPLEMTKDQYEYGSKVVRDFAGKLQFIINYVSALDASQMKAFVQMANDSGIIQLIEKMTEKKNLWLRH